MKSIIATISLELDILNDQLKRFGNTECKHRRKGYPGKCGFFADAGKPFHTADECSIKDCPLLNNT